MKVNQLTSLTYIVDYKKIGNIYLHTYIRVNTTLGSSLRSGIFNNYDIFDTTCYFKLQLWT